MIVLHVFAKKSEKTPRRAIEVARERMKKWKESASGT
ncbi:MAG: type II toxin-antitoxin system RelE/ParE family toxin [Dongiaceae bacterium]